MTRSILVGGKGKSLAGMSSKEKEKKGFEDNTYILSRSFAVKGYREMR